MVTFLDDDSNYIFAISRKSNILKQFRKFQTNVENIQNKNIKQLPSDNGIKYVNLSFKEHCILHRPHHMRHNKMVKPKNRT